MEKSIVFRNKNGKQLVGILHLPKGKRKLPLVVICHGLGATKTVRRFIELARKLERNKIATFRFDFEGCGDSEGNLRTITIKRQVSDLQSAMGWVLKQRWVNKKQVAFVGHSLGTLVVALFIAQNEFPAKTLILWAPAFDQRGLMEYFATPG